MATQPYPLYLSGPKTAMGTAITLQAHSIDSGSNMYRLKEQLAACRVVHGPGWAQALGSNIFHLFGDVDLDVAPFLQQLADWLKDEGLTVEIIVTSYDGKQLKQIQSVFPGAIFRPSN